MDEPSGGTLMSGGRLFAGGEADDGRRASSESVTSLTNTSARGPSGRQYPLAREMLD